MFSDSVMYSVFVLFSLVAVVASEATEDECKKLGHPRNLDCCKSLKDDPEHMTEIKECFKGKMKSGPEGPPLPPTCEMDICIGKKMGFSDDDGNLDKAAFEKVLKENIKDYANKDAAFSFIKTECIEEIPKSYGPPGACALAQTRHCVETGLVLTCTEFDSKPHCVDLKNKVEECKAVLHA